MTTDNTPAPAGSRSGEDYPVNAWVQYLYGCTNTSTEARRKIINQYTDNFNRLIRRRELESQIALVNRMTDRVNKSIDLISGEVKDILEQLQAELDKLTEGRGE